MWFLAQQTVLIPNQCSKGDHFPFPVLFNTLFLTVLACEARAAWGSRGSGGVSNITFGSCKGRPSLIRLATMHPRRLQLQRLGFLLPSVYSFRVQELGDGVPPVEVNEHARSFTVCNVKLLLLLLLLPPPPPPLIIITYLLTPWSRVLLEKLTGSAASQEIPRIFGTPKVHHRTHKCPPPVPILSQLHPVPTTLSHFLKIHLNIILPSACGSPEWSLSLRFPHQNPVDPSPLPHTRHMPRPAHQWWWWW